MRLRPYKPCDAEKIVSWCRDEHTFLMWGGDRFGSFPISAGTMNRKYLEENGDCADDDFYPMTALEGDEPVGHFIIRRPGPDSRVLRFGWVIVDDSRRGQGLGRRMLLLGLKFAFEVMKAEKVTIGVYEDNTRAYSCYLSAGFRRTEDTRDHIETVSGEEWNTVELEIDEKDWSDSGKPRPSHIIAVAGTVLNEDGDILMVRDDRRGWTFPGGQVEEGENVIDALKREIMEETGVDISVGEVFCISSNTCRYPGYNGVKEVPTKIMLDFICRTAGGTPRPSGENSESAFIPREKVSRLLTSPAMARRYRTYTEYDGRPAYLEYVTWPDFNLKLKRNI